MVLKSLINVSPVVINFLNVYGLQESISNVSQKNQSNFYFSSSKFSGLIKYKMIKFPSAIRDFFSLY